MSTELRAVVALIFQLEDELDAREEAHRQELERQGMRLVSGGQIGAYGADGKAPWEVKDFRTGEVLAQGRGRPEDMDRSWRKEWYQAENVGETGGVEDFERFPADVPQELIDLIREHVTRPSVAKMYREWVAG